MTAEALSGPDEQITPANKDFGAVALGSASATQTFTIKNLGDFPDQIQQVFTVAGSPQSFPVSNDGCTMHVVMPDDSCTFDVSFTPVSAGAKEASIFVISSGPSPVTQVGLSGRGYAEPGVAAVLNGNPEVGKTLECDPINAEGDLAYRWIRDGAPIAGATARDYLVQIADIGHSLGPKVTGHSGGSTADFVGTASTVRKLGSSLRLDVRRVHPAPTKGLLVWTAISFMSTERPWSTDGATVVAYKRKDGDLKELGRTTVARGAAFVRLPWKRAPHDSTKVMVCFLGTDVVDPSCSRYAVVRPGAD